MKKGIFVTYTLIVLFLGSIIGGSLAWAFGISARVQMGGQQVGITMLSKNSARVMVYSGPQIIRIDNHSPVIDIYFE